MKILGFPPLEERSKSLKVCNSSVDYFGAGTLSKKDLTYCSQCRERSLEDMFVVLSDIWLDDVEVWPAQFFSSLCSSCECICLHINPRVFFVVVIDTDNGAVRDRFIRL